MSRVLSSTRPFPARFVAPLLWTTSLNPINSSIIATSLVAVGTAFGVGAGQTAVLVAAVYVTSAVAQPAMGKFGAAFGPRRVLLAGLAILLAGGLVGAFAPSFEWLIASRALIGIGTAAGYPGAMALIRLRADAAGTGIPGSVLGGVSIAAQVTSALGLPLGGALVGVWGWPAVFAVNVPLAVLGGAMVLLWIPVDDPRPRRTARELVTELDPAGLGLFAVAVVALIAVLTDIRHPSLWLVALFVLAVAALIAWERRAAVPFIDVRMLARNGPLLRTYIRQALSLLAAYTVLYGYVQWLEDGRGLAASVSGLVMLPMSGVAAVCAGVISRRALIRTPLLVSAVAMMGGGAAIALVDGSTGIPALIGLSLVFGLVLGLTSTSNQAALYMQTTTDQIGVASGLLRTASYVGAIFATGLIGIAFPERATDGGLHLTGWVIGVLGVALALFVALDRRLPARGR